MAKKKKKADDAVLMSFRIPPVIREFLMSPQAGQGSMTDNLVAILGQSPQFLNFRIDTAATVPATPTDEKLAAKRKTARKRTGPRPAARKAKR